MVRINRLLTQLLPFSIWSLLKPIKTNYEYIIDENGRVGVNHIGKTSHLQEDLELLLKSKNIPFTYSPSKENKSTHKGVDIYFSKALHRKLFTFRYSKEIKLYQSLLKYSISDDLQGRRVDEL